MNMMNMGGNAFDADEALADAPTEEQAVETPVEADPDPADTTEVTEAAKEEV